MKAKLIIVLLILSYFAGCILTGCYTERKASKELNKAMSKFPSLLAEVARENFPCDTTEVKSDTITEVEFLEVEVECPDSVIISENFRDTVYKVAAKVKVKREIKTIRINKTITIVDRADVASITADRDEWKVKYQNGKAWKWIALVFIGFGVLVCYLAFRNKSIPKN